MSVVLVHEIWAIEPARDYPIVTHEFRGETREEVYSAYLDHRAIDDLIRDCGDHDEYTSPSGEIVHCFVRWWYDDDDSRQERVVRAWLAEARRTRSSTEASSADGSSRAFRPRVIRGGAAAATISRPFGHEDHDPDLCDAKTG